MIKHLLDAGYLAAAAALSPWIAYKAAVTGKYRQGLWRKLTGAVPRGLRPRPSWWFHAVSVGEVLALRPVLEELGRRRPDRRVVISTTTNTGLDVARRTFPAIEVFYYPLDFSWAVARALDHVRPKAIALVELELWPNFLLAAADRHIPVAVINGRLSDRSYPGYRRLRHGLRPVLRAIQAFGVQTPLYARRFIDIGADPQRVVVTGSVKYDAVLTDRDHPRTRELARLLDIRPSDRVFIAGSTQAPEEEIALEVFHRLHPRWPDLRLIVVPRHKERFDEVARLLQSRTRGVVRRSQLNGQPLADRQAVVLLDTLGELQYLYGLGHIAFVGGSLVPRGGQNMLDPAGMGCAVLLGPHTFNFRATVEQLLEVGSARVVHNAAELEAAVADLLAHPEEVAAMARRARTLIASQQGATGRTVDLLEKLLDRAAGRHPRP